MPLVCPFSAPSCRLPHSIQRVAVWILEKYYHDFPVYNPALLNLPKSVLAKKVSGFKVYSLGEGEQPCSSALPCLFPRRTPTSRLSLTLRPLLFPFLSLCSSRFCSVTSLDSRWLSCSSYLLSLYAMACPLIWLLSISHQPWSKPFSSWSCRTPCTGEEHLQDSCASSAFLFAFLWPLPEVARRVGIRRYCWVVGTASSGRVRLLSPELLEWEERPHSDVTISSTLFLCRKQHQQLHWPVSGCDRSGSSEAGQQSQ